MKNIFLLVLASNFFYFANAQSRLYVNVSAAGGNNGQSWNDAFSDLQTALQTAQTGDEVWVASGTYYPTSTTDRNISFEPKSGVKLYGGFSGNETAVAQRDWTTHVAFLSGDIGINGDSSDNSLTVIYLLQSDTSTVLDGFTVCFGVADDEVGAGSTRDRAICGGGLYIEAGNWDAFPSIQNCRFWRNTAHSFGGAVMVNGSSDASVAPRFVNCRFEENICLGSGGGLSRFGGSWRERGKEFEGCHFSQNHAALQGGGLYYSDSKGPNTVSLHGCSFTGNMAVFTGGGAYFQTGKVGKSGLNIQHCEFEANKALGGAAIMIFTNGNDFDGEATIDSCAFFRNISPTGGLSSIIYTDQFSTPLSVVKLGNSIVEENWSDAFTFSFSWINAEMLIENLLFKKNKAGGIIGQFELFTSVIQNTKFQSNDCSRIGVHNFYGSNTAIGFSNCLFEKNKTTNATGLFTFSSQKFTVRNSAFLYEDHFADYYNRFISSDCDSFFLFNTIITDSISKWSFSNGGNKTAFLSNNSFGFIDCNDQFPNVICGPNNLFGLDPMFRDTANHDYSLLPCSPLINAGSNTPAFGIPTDLAGNPRIQGGTVDIGAYESPAFSLAAEPSIKPACAGTSNGSISIAPVSGCEPYDYNWSPQAGNGPELTGLPPGNYLLTITDGSGRKILDTLVVALAPMPALNPFSTDVQCGNTLGGTVTAGTGNGTAPYHYQWQPTAADTAYLNHLSPGAYALTVIDANGCQDSASATIALQGMITLMVDGQSISCFGETDGWLSAAPATGAAPFQWLWQGWPGTDSLAQPLGPGNYAVTVSDRYGCTAAFTFPTMNAPDSISIGTGSSSQTQSNPPNGAAVVTTVSGGTSPYDFSWSTGGTGQAIAGLTAGFYTVTVTDDRGCTASAVVEVKLMVGTEDLELKGLLIYPNPAADWVQVVLPENTGAWRLELSDASGRLISVTALKGETTRIDLRGLAVGTYLITLQSELGAVVGQVVKQ